MPSGRDSFRRNRVAPVAALRIPLSLESCKKADCPEVIGVEKKGVAADDAPTPHQTVDDFSLHQQLLAPNHVLISKYCSYPRAAPIRVYVECRSFFAPSASFELAVKRNPATFCGVLKVTISYRHYCIPPSILRELACFVTFSVEWHFGCPPKDHGHAR